MHGGLCKKARCVFFMATWQQRFVIIMIYKAYKEVVQLFRNETKEWYHVFVDGEEIICTGGHPFYVVNVADNRERICFENKDSEVTGKWITAQDLKILDKVLLSDGSYGIITVISIEKLSTPETTYNFEVADFHTYYVSDSNVLVHNKCWKWGEGGRGSVDNNIDYHYKWHGDEVGAVNRADYVQMSYNFAEDILDMGIQASHKVSGATKNIFRYHYQGYYIDMNINKGIIVSFGIV